MSTKKFRGAVSNALYEGYTPQKIYKEIRKEYSIYRKNLNRTIIEAKKYGEDIKNDILPLIEKSKKLQQKDLRYLNPAREQIKQLNKIKIKDSYKNPVLVYRPNDEGKLIVPDYDWIKLEKTKMQKKTLNIFREDFNKNIKREIKRFNKYGKSLNLNKLTLKVRGNEMSISEIYSNYVKTNDKNLKIALRKKLNYGFEQLKKIKVSKHSALAKRIYSGNLEKIEDGNIEDNLDSNVNFHTVDSNNNVFGWYILRSPELVLEGEIEQRGSGSILWDSHYQQLENEGMNLHDTTFLMLWRRLKQNNL